MFGKAVAQPERASTVSYDCETTHLPTWVITSRTRYAEKEKVGEFSSTSRAPTYESRADLSSRHRGVGVPPPLGECVKRRWILYSSMYVGIKYVTTPYNHMHEAIPYARRNLVFKLYAKEEATIPYQPGWRTGGIKFPFASRRLP
jgi:hypothetical protein